MSTTVTTTIPNEAEVELQPIPKAIHPSSPSSIKQQQNRDAASTQNVAAIAESAFPPTNDDAPIVRAKQKWNEPAVNKYRILATFFSFIVIGASDGVYGALVPSIRTDFELSNTVVSLIFMTPFIGYTLATLAVNKLHMTLGQRGIAIIGPVFHLVPFVVMAVHPPYPVYLFTYMFVGLANGLIDAAWNAWIGDMSNANTLMGVLHAMYGVGATISPTVAATMLRGGLGWWTFYWILAGFSVLELVLSGWLFWPETAAKYRENNQKEPGSASGSRTGLALKNKVTWMIALFLFAYMGVEVSTGGWIVDFMIQERNGEPFDSGFVPTGFWAGVTLGRLLLGPVSERFGERITIAVYLAISVVLQIVAWVVPKFMVTAVMVALLGFFTGPLFPGAVVVTAKLLPKHLHTPGIGFASAFAGGGAAILPFLAGAIAEPHGVKSLQPFILSLLVVITVFWLLLPRQKKAAQN